MDNAIGAGMLRVRAILLISSALAMIVPLSAQGGQLELSGSQVGRFSDNPTNSARNKKSDLESTTALTAAYVTDPGRCNATFSGTVGYTVWQEDSYDNETSASMNLDSVCEMSPGWFWDLDNNLREVNQDTTQSDTPDNRTLKNVLSTGPRYVWRLGSRDSISFSTRYENTAYEDPDETDSDRYIGSVDWSHLISQTLTGGINSSYTATRLDNGAKVNVQTVRATFSKRWPTTSLTGAFGVSEIETDLGGTTQTSDGFVGNLELNRQLTPSTDWYLRAARELTDRTSSYDIQFGEFEFNLDESVSVQTTSVSTGVNKRFSDQGSLNINLFTNQSDLIETDETEESTGLNLGYSRTLTGRVTGNTSFGYRYSSFGGDNSDNQIIDLEFGLGYRVGRKLSLSASLGHEQKASDVSSREYDEFWAQLGLDYKFL